MADSDALRQRRRRAHLLGDHSMCRRCPAVRGERLTVAEVEPGSVIDPLAALNASAARLIALYEADPANVAAA